MADRPIRVVLVDDHDVIHVGLESALEDHPDIHLTGNARNEEDLKELLAQSTPEVVVLDLFLCEGPSWGLCRDLKAAAPAPAVLIYSAYGNSQLLERAMNCGADGYALKSTPTDELPLIIRLLRAGENYWDPSLHQSWEQEHQRTTSRVFPPREVEIIALISQGLDNFEIAERLHLSHHSVKFHIGKALKRSGETTRAGLVRCAMDAHLLPHILPGEE